jgi:ATP-dependent DNA helicase PIF1
MILGYIWQWDWTGLRATQLGSINFVFVYNRGMRQAQALNVMLSGRSVFLTGPPGAGKTYVLNEFVRWATRAGKTVAVTASTGIAATHISGTTIHSWSGLGIRDFLSDQDKMWLRSNDRLEKRYRSTDVLVIDEVSMLHGARLDMINEACKLLRDSELPFGGLQVVLVGDLFQLPPVTRGGPVDFAHTSSAWQELSPAICYLSEQHRQSGGGLLSVLEAMRSGEISDHHGDILRSRMEVTPESDVLITRLYAHNIDVEAINQRHLADITETSRTYSMRTHGGAAKVDQLKRSVLAPEELELKVGAEVMFVANNFTQRFVNGSRGRVVGFEEDLPLVQLVSRDKVVKVEPHSWSLNEDGKKRAEVVQLPLRLAWAITIHKSQGMSLDGAEIDLSRTFEPGMGYVALSRVRSLEGIYLKGMNAMALRMHEGIDVFDRQLRQLSATLAAQTEDIAEEPPEPAQEPKPDIDMELFDKLKAWRLSRARLDKVAPFIIAHNSLFEAIASRKPLTESQLLGLPGFGKKKLDTYGADILALVASHTNDENTSKD